MSIFITKTPLYTFAHQSHLPVSVRPGALLVLHKCSVTRHRLMDCRAAGLGRTACVKCVGKHQPKPWVKKQTRQWEDADWMHPSMRSAFIWHETIAELLQLATFCRCKVQPFVQNILCVLTRVKKRRQAFIGSFLLILHFCPSGVFKYSYEQGANICIRQWKGSNCGSPPPPLLPPVCVGWRGLLSTH